MSDDCISESPITPRCPVCATGFTATPGANCPACGRTFAPSDPRAMPDLRRPSLDTKSIRLQKPVLIWMAVVLLVGTGIAWIVYDAPGLGIFVAIPLVPALIRTIRLATLTRTDDPKAGPSFLLWSLLASFSVTVLAAIAGGVAAGAICAAGAVTDNLLVIVIACFVGNIVGVGVFLYLFYKLWPRAATDHGKRLSRDPDE